MSAVIPFVNNSYNLVLMDLSCLGLYSTMTSFAISFMKVSYSGEGMKDLSDSFSFLILAVWSIIMDFLRFLLEKLVIEKANY